MTNPVEKLRQLGQQKLNKDKVSQEAKNEPNQKESKNKVNASQRIESNSSQRSDKIASSQIKEPRFKEKNIIDLEIPKEHSDPELADKIMKAIHEPEPEIKEQQIKLVSSEHQDDCRADFIEEHLKVNINVIEREKEDRPKILNDEYDIPCSCPNKVSGKFISRYDCERCNPLKQEQRNKLRKELVKQINSCKEKLLAMEAIDGIKIDERTGEQIKEIKDNRTLFQKMTGF